MNDTDLSQDWRCAIAQAAAASRVVVLGATDMGKSTFIRQLVAASGRSPMLIDLDPGQKMIGPPGTVALGSLDPPKVARFVFVGTTSSSAMGRITRAAADLAEGAGAFVANTSGFVTGLGARLQAATVASLRPDLIVEIVSNPDAPPVVPSSWTGSVLRVTRSSAARRKSPGARTRLRQEAFEAALGEASNMVLRRQSVRFDPAPPLRFTGPERPVCALADNEGRDISYGILVAADEEEVSVIATPADVRSRIFRLGKMWARPRDTGWRLEEKLSPSWMSDAS